MTELRTKASKKLGALKHIQRARLQRGRENDVLNTKRLRDWQRKNDRTRSVLGLSGTFPTFFRGMGIPTTYIEIFLGTKRLKIKPFLQGELNR